MMLDVEIRHVLESLFTERFPDIPLETSKAEHTAPPADDPEGKPVIESEDGEWVTLELTVAP